jgi:hypothetical protein
MLHMSRPMQPGTGLVSNACIIEAKIVLTLERGKVLYTGARKNLPLTFIALIAKSVPRPPIVGRTASRRE